MPRVNASVTEHLTVKLKRPGQGEPCHSSRRFSGEVLDKRLSDVFCFDLVQLWTGRYALDLEARYVVDWGLAGDRGETTNYAAHSFRFGPASNS